MIVPRPPAGTLAIKLHIERAHPEYIWALVFRDDTDLHTYIALSNLDLGLPPALALDGFTGAITRTFTHVAGHEAARRDGLGRLRRV